MTASRTRWLILALVFAAGIINYADRQIIAVLKPVLEEQFNWSDRDFAHMGSAFQLTAAAAFLGAGWYIDKVGLRIGYPIAVGAWSAAAIAHAFARTVPQFIFVRALLGAAEAVNTPASVKAVATWFPVKERSLALGIMNTATNIGAIITPLSVPIIALAWGWQWAFIIPGLLGFVWVICWFLVKKPVQDAVAAQEAETSTTVAPPADKVRWTTLFKDRRTWAIAGAKALTDQVWWFLLFWMPDFFSRVFELNMRQVGPPVAAIYAMAAVGAFTGGLIPSRLMAAGWSVNRARKTTMFVAALLVLPVILVFQVESHWAAVFLVGMALFAHQAFSTNIFAFTADIFPARIVGSAIGIGALAGNLSGMAMLEFTGWVLDTRNVYWPMFAIVSVSYMLAFLWIQLLVPVIRTPEDRPV